MQNMQDSYLNIIFCGLISTDISPYHVLIEVYWPTFDLSIQKFGKFRDIPRYMLNSVFMSRFRNSGTLNAPIYLRQSSASFFAQM